LYGLFIVKIDECPDTERRALRCRVVGNGAPRGPANRIEHVALNEEPKFQDIFPRKCGSRSKSLFVANVKMHRECNSVPAIDV